MPGYKHSPKPASLRESHASHVRYGHGLIPRLLHVSCPKCGAMASATNTRAHPDSLFVGFGLHQESWALICPACPHRSSQLEYKELPSLFWRVNAGGTELWSWNRDHLIMLRRLLSGEVIASDPYEPLATYARREWLLDRNRGPLVKAISFLLSAPAA